MLPISGEKRLKTIFTRLARRTRRTGLARLAGYACAGGLLLATAQPTLAVPSPEPRTISSGKEVHSDTFFPVLTYDSITLEEGTKDGDTILVIVNGFGLTSTKGTTVKKFGELNIGTSHPRTSWQDYTQGAVHTGNVSLLGGLESDTDEAYKGVMVYNAMLHVFTGSVAKPNQIVGNLAVGGAANGGTVVFGSDETDTPLRNADTWLKVTGDATFSAKSSLLLFQAHDTILEVGGTLTVKDGSQLYVAAGQAGTYDLVKAGSLDVDSAAWVEGNLASHSLLNVSGAWDTGNNTYKLTLARNSSQEVMPALSASSAGMLDAVFATFGVNENASNASVKFLSRAANTDRSGSAAESAALIEGASQMGAVGGAAATSLGAAGAASAACAARTGASTPMGGSMTVALNSNGGSVTPDTGPGTGLAAGSSYSNGLGVWAMPLYQHARVSGLKAGEFKTGFDSDLGGLAMGADYTLDSRWRLGFSLNAGGGKSRSNGDFATTKTDIAFWGANLYGGVNLDRLTLSGDMGYTGTTSEMRQKLPESMGMGANRADVDSAVWTFGLKAEYLLPIDALHVTPYAGARYNRINVDAYDVKNDGVVFSVDEASQDLWLFPVGVTLGKDFSFASGWTLAPQLSLGGIFAAGDVDAKSRARTPGVAQTADMSIQVVDRATFDSTLGLAFSKDAVSLGLNYNLQLSDHRSAHGLTATMRYDF